MKSTIKPETANQITANIIRIINFQPRCAAYRLNNDRYNSMANITWRQIASPIIYRVLAENKGKSEKEIKKALHDAYPFGPRSMHPYKVWCDEIQRQRGKKKGKNNYQPTQPQLF